MKKSFKILMLACMASLASLGVYAQDEPYNENDLADIRAFLRKPSAQEGKANFEQFWITVEDTATWETSTEWVWKASAQWKVIDGEQRVVQLNWFNKNLAGDFSMPHASCLETVNISSNAGIPSVDVSSNTALKQLVVASTGLQDLDVSQNGSLESLTVSKTALMELDLAGNPNLRTLDLNNTQIRDIDLSRNPLLGALYCQNCAQLGNIDFYNNLSLTWIDCRGCTALETLDLSSLAGLERVYCMNSSIKTLDLRSNQNLKFLHCYGNGMEYLRLPASPVLSQVLCQDNALRTIEGLSGLASVTELNVSNNRLSSLDVSGMTEMIRFDCSGNGLKEIAGLQDLKKMQEFKAADNALVDLANLNTTEMRTLLMENNALRFSTLPTRAKGKNQTGFYITDEIETYAFYPQAVINGGVVIPGTVIDLSEEASKTFGDTTHATTYSWFELGAEMEEKEVELESTAAGVFQMDASMAGKTLRCKMTNAFFWFNNGQVNDTAFPIVYEVYVAGDEIYVSEELAALKAFLRQESAEAGRSNAEALGVDTSAWAESNLWLWNVEGLRLGLDAEKRIAAIDWSGKGLAGNLDLPGFAQLDSLDVSDNALTALALDDCPALQKIRCQDNALRFSTLPKVNADLFEMAPQKEIDLGRVDYSDGIDLRSENEVVVNGSSTVTEYRWVIVTAQGETETTALTNRDGLFIPDTSLCGKNLRVYMTNEAYWGETPASQLRLCADVFVNHYVEPTYSEEELAQLRSFLRQEGNFAELGLAVADTADWTENSTWVADVEGMEWAVFGNEYKVVEISWADKGLAGNLDLSGFDALEIVHVYDNDLVSLNLSGAEALAELRMYNNFQCEELNLQGCKALQRLYVQNCALQELDVAFCEALVFVQAFNNKLQAFDASNKTALTTLYLHNNKLETIDLAGCTALQTLNVSDNHLKELNVGASQGLIMLDCGGNSLTFATLPKQAIASYNYAPQAGLTGETILYTEGIDLSLYNSVVFPGEEAVKTDYAWFDVTTGEEVGVDDYMVNDGTGKFTIDKYLSGTDLRCKMTNGKYPGLTITFDIILEETLDEYNADELADLRSFLRQPSAIEGSTNAIAARLQPSDTASWNTSGKWLVRLTKNERLGWTYVEENGKQEKRLRMMYLMGGEYPVTGELLLPHCTELVELDAYSLGLTKLDVSNSTKLEWLTCDNNELTELDLAKLERLGYLNCSRNKLRTLDVSGKHHLRTLTAYNNLLTDVNLTGCDSLIALLLQGNQLESLDVTTCVSLRALHVTGNGMSELDLSKNVNLTDLYASYNEFDYFDLRPNKQIYDVHLDHNILEKILLTDLVIEEIDIRYNELTFSTIPFDFTRKDYYFAPQDTVDLGTIPVNGTLDISSEYMLAADGTHSYYEWQIQSGSEWVATDDVITVDETGIFVFDKDAEGRRYRCLITSDNIYRCVLTMEYYVDVVEASSNAEADKLEVAVYPNPVTDELHVSASCAIGTIRLFDMNGRVIYQCEEGGPEHQIDMENYPAGMYFLDVDGLLRKKVVKR